MRPSAPSVELPSAVPAAARRGAPWLAGALVALLVPAAHGLALAHQWLYFPAGTIEDLLAAGPLQGVWRAPLLRETAGFAVELLVVTAVLAALLRRHAGGWARAVREAALHVLPLGLAPVLLFVDDVATRGLLYATLFAAVAGAAAFRLVPDEPERAGRSPWPRRLALVAALIATTYYVALAWLQHSSYWSSLYDLGLFAGALRSTVHGNGILFSPQLGSTFLAEHFAPILVLLTPLYALYQDPMTLQVVQAVSMATAGYLIFLLAEDTLDDGWLALAFCLSYLLLPTTFAAQWHGFKMDLLEPPLVVGALLAIRRRRASWLLLCIALLWATKEDAVIATAVLGAYAWWSGGMKRLGPALIVASVAYGLLVFGLVLPAYARFQEPGPHYGTFSADHYKFASHFFHLGPTLPRAMWNAATNPLYDVGWATSDVRMASVLTVLVPLGCFALGGGLRTLLLLLPAGEMILSNFAYMYTLDIYYSCIPMALAYGAAIDGFAALRTRLRRSPRLATPAFTRRLHTAAIAYLSVAVLLLAWSDPHSPLGPVHSRPAYLRTPRTRLLDRVIASIPPAARESSTGYEAIHLMNRPRPEMLPFGLDSARYLLVDLYRPGFPFPGHLATLVPFLRKLIDSPHWGVRLADHGVYLLERDAPRDLNARALAGIDEPDIEAEEWESSDFSNLGVYCADCSNGAALRVGPGDRRGDGLLLWGQNYPLMPGTYRAAFRLAAARESYEAPGRLAATIDVYGSGQTLVSRDLRFADFARPGAWQEFTIDFTVDRFLPLEFRVDYHDAGTVALDVIRIRKTPP